MSYEPLASSEFQKMYFSLSSDLAQLLDITILDVDEDCIEKYLHDSFSQIMHFHNEEAYKARDVEIFRLAFLRKHLKNIQKYDSNKFEEFRNRLKSEGYDEYFGIRFEIAIASSFIDKELGFEARETPDFEIQETEKIFAECTSSHLAKERERGLEYKIERAIRDKTGEPYDSKNTALMIEATNLSHHMAATDASLKKKEDLKEHLKPKIEKSDYGSVLIFTFLFKEKNFSSKYIRIDNSSIDSELKAFLNNYYAEDDVHIEKPWFPREG